MPQQHVDRYTWQKHLPSRSPAVRLAGRSGRTVTAVPRRIVVRAVPYVLTTDAADRVQVLTKQSLLIENDTIVDMVRAGRERAWLKSADLVYDASLRGGIVLTPGFINVHAHPPMYLLRSTTLLEREHATTEESLELARAIERVMTVPDQIIAALGDFTEQQKFGTTTILSHYHTPQATRAAAKQAGVRLVDMVSVASLTDPRASMQRARPWLRSTDPMITTGITIHTLQRVSQAKLAAVRRLLQQYRQLRLTIHCGETAAEVAAVEARHGQRPIAVLRQAGLLSRRLILSHAVHLTNEEIAVLGKYHVGIAHLPTSNRLHQSGELKYSDFVVAGNADSVALGTDSVISKSRLDLMSEAFLCKLTHQASTHPASWFDVFCMLTCNAARIVGLHQRVGKVLPGYKADLVFWKLKDRMFLPFAEHDPTTLLGNFIAHGGYVARDVMVNGRFVISNRRHNLVNESKLLEQLQQHHLALRKRVLRKRRK